MLYTEHLGAVELFFNPPHSGRNSVVKNESRAFIHSTGHWGWCDLAAGNIRNLGDCVLLAESFVEGVD